jgi:hypothetical protein
MFAMPVDGCPNRELLRHANLLDNGSLRRASPGHGMTWAPKSGKNWYKV